MKRESQGFRKLNLWVALLMGLVLIVLSFTLAWTDFQKTINQQFAIEASKIQEQLHHKVAVGNSVLDSLSSLFTAIPYVNEEAFRVVSEGFLSKYSFLTAIAYFHFTEPDQRKVFETEMQGRGYAGFHIKQSINGELQPAKKSSYYLPLMFIEPFSVQNIMMLGLDINAESTLQQTLNNVVNNKTSQGSFTQGALKPLGQYWVFMPIYAGKNYFYQQQQSKNDLRGLVATGLDLSKLLYNIDLPNNISIELSNLKQSTEFIISSGQINKKNFLLLRQKLVLEDPTHPFLLHINKSIAFSEIPKSPFIFAFMVSSIITLLLIFVARINASRNLELINRNDEITDQVTLKTKALQQTKTELEESMSLLQSSERKYRSLIETTSEGFWMIDPSFHTLYINDSLCKMLGYQRDYMLEKSVFDFVNEENKLIFSKQISQIETMEHRQYEISLTSRKGNLIPVIFAATTLKNSSGEIEGAFAFITDITERKQAEDKLHLAASVFTHASEGIIITNSQGNILDVNAGFTRITGYSKEEVVGKNPRFLKSGHQDGEYYAAMWFDLLNKGYWFGEVWNRRKNGEVYAQMLSINIVKDENAKPQHYVGLFSAITSQKDHQKQLEHIAHYDALTNLPNRVLLADRLIQAMAQAHRRGSQLAVVFLDLDGFKNINDRYGHDIGDQLLMNLAVRFKEALREGDSIARLGGDEFVAILIDLSSEKDCVPLLERLLDAAIRPLSISNRVLNVSASLGVTFYPQTDEIDADQLLRQADQAMYQAKLAGKNQFQVFDTNQDHNIRDHHESLERIRKAIADEEFVLYFQPKVNLSTGEVIGAEALIRWQHPEQGLLPPDTFLPIIENDPLALELDSWVIKTALTQLANWHQSGLKLSISVNIGSQYLQYPNFIQRLQEQLNAHPQIENHYLELEILETSALEDIDYVSKIIKSCQSSGVRFALDDFGTGYSSLAYLKRLPAETIKIDRSFVIDMLENTEDLAILEGILGLSIAFKREVVAEGVETVEHGVLLLQLGCHLAQGYGIARPMDAEKLPQWISNWKPDLSWLNVNRVSNDDLSLLYASIEHRAWVRGIEDYVINKNTTPPPLESTECCLGHWLNSEEIERYNLLPAYQNILPLHTEIHELGENLCSLREKNQFDKALAQEKIDELNNMRDDMVNHLQTLLYESQAS
ncbi:MAG: EAL domain-containing protein [Pseudomonadota bacterium]